MTIQESIKCKIRGTRLRVTKALYGLPEIDFKNMPGHEVEIASPILDSICMPPFYYTDDHDDFHPLQKLAKAADPKVIVELGTAHGNTTANLALNCPNAKIFTVNAPLDLMTGEATTFSLTKNDIGRVYLRAGFADRIVQILENTLHLDLGKYLQKAEVDFGIIDACHDRDYVLNDFLKLEPLMSERGVILLHDTHPGLGHSLMGSYRACMELRRRGYDIRHIRNTWWGIWCRDWSRFNKGNAHS